jgi:7-cyano-7-deazaguanine synthase in queuosine biosynthesis
MNELYFLFSGGYDSIAALDMIVRWGKAPTLLFVDYSQAAADMEANALEFFANRYSLPSRRIVASDYIKMVIPKPGMGWVFSGDVGETKDFVLPGRNIFLLTIAAIAVYSPESEEVGFIMGTHREENLPEGEYSTPGDCSPVFFANMMKALSVGMSTPAHKIAYHMFLPLRDMTKDDIFNYIVVNKLPYDRAWSCYGAGPSPCGKCPHCIENTRELSRIKFELAVEKGGTP